MSSNLPHLSPPTHLTPARAALAALAASGGALGLELVLRIGITDSILREPRDALALAMCTALLCAFLGAIATRARTLGAAMALTSLAVPFGVVNTALSFVVVATLQVGPKLETVILCAGLGMLYGVMLGAPLGVALGAIFAIPIGSAVNTRALPSHDGPDRAFTTIGAWLLLAGGAALALEVTRDPGPVPASLATEAFPVLAAGMGGALLVRGVLGRAARALWLRRVARGESPEWRIVPSSGGLDLNSILPLCRAIPGACDGVIVRLDPAGDPPYRAMRYGVACALVRLDQLPRPSCESTNA